MGKKIHLNAFIGFLYLASLLILSSPLRGQHRVSFDVLSGAVYNLPSSLIIRQDGFETIRLKARYISEPFKLPPYYDFRLSLWKENKSAWGIKFTHHKLILDNLTPEVQRFEITHGYNIISVTKIIVWKNFMFNAALGAVIANPQSLIRGKYFHGGGLFNNGYYLSGAVAELAAGRQFFLTRNWYLMGELRVTGAWARVKVSDGYADVPNKAVHFLIGTGYYLFSFK